MIKNGVITLIISLALLPALASAHGPSRQKVVKQIEINAAAEQVWAVLADFCSIREWNELVTECTADSADQPDTIRTITLQNGQQLKEKLVKHAADRGLIQFMLVEPNPDAMPINTLGSSITVTANDSGGSTVEWKAAFYRSFPGPTPPPELSDEAAVRAVSELLDAGLAGIKISAEQ